MTPDSPGGGPPRQLRPTDVKRLNREWRRRTEGRLALLLDSVSQPFNVGSIVRTAAAFGAEVAAHHQGRLRAGSEPGEPAAQQVVQRRLADPDRRVGPDPGEPRRDTGRAGGDAADVAQARRGRVPRAQAERALVDVDGPHRRRGGTLREHAGHRAVAAAQVEQVALGRRRGRLLQEQPGPGVEAAGGEDTRIGLELQVDVRQHDPDQAGAVCRPRARVEVVRAHRLTGWAAGSAALSAGLMYRRVIHRSTTNVSTGIVPASSSRTVGPIVSRSLRARA